MKNQLTVTFVKEEKTDSRRQTVLRKQQNVCNSVEIKVFKKYLSLLKYFHFCHIYTRKKQRLKLTPLPTPKRALAVQMSLTHESLLDEVKEVLQKRNVDSTRERLGRESHLHWDLQKNLNFTTYEFFIVD